MFSFEWPALFLLLPAPWFIRRYIPKISDSAEQKLIVPDLSWLSAVEKTGGQSHQSFRPWLLYVISWILLLLACSRPQWAGDSIEIPVTGRDMMLAVDLSESMRESDFVVNGKSVDRLTATKVVANDFINRRIGDRLGLILFGQQAYLQVPLTFDHVTLKQLLSEAVIGIAGRQTAIGDALGIAVKRLREEKSLDKILILMTDGRNTSGEISPLRAASLAAESGLKIHTIGIGADDDRGRGFFGSIRRSSSQDLDEKTLLAIAERTGGRYFRAHDTASFEDIYKELDRIEPIEHDGEYFQPRAELFMWPAGFSILTLTLGLILQRLRS